MSAPEPYRSRLYDHYVTEHQGELREDRSEPSLLADIIGRAQNDFNARILDVGCGQGQLIRLFERSGWHDVQGIDVSPEQIALAHDLGTRTAQLGDLLEFAEAHAGSFDLVTAVDVVEHFDRCQVPDVFAAFERVLRPGGRLILRTPNGSSPYSGRYLFSDLTHGTIYTDISLRQVASNCGLADVVAYPARPVGTTLKQRVRRLVWLAIEAAMRVPLIVETGKVRGHIVTQNLICVMNKPPSTPDRARAEARSSASSLRATLSRRGRAAAARVAQRLPRPLKSLLKQADWAAARWVRTLRERSARGSIHAPAAFGVDVRLLELLGPFGTFVEAGANDGVTESNTYLLERSHGWTGLLVEPMPELARQARINRPGTPVAEAALVATARNGDQVDMYYGNLWSSVAVPGRESDASAHARRGMGGALEDVRLVRVSARTLSSLIDEHALPQVDLLSLDIEGYEPQALRGLDLSRHRPKWILVEARTSPELLAVTDVLGDLYELVEHIGPRDVLLRRTED